MERQFTPSSRLVRSASAVLAAMATALVVTLVGDLFLPEGRPDRLASHRRGGERPALVAAMGDSRPDRAGDVSDPHRPRVPPEEKGLSVQEPGRY